MPAHVRGTETSRRVDEIKGVDTTTDHAPGSQRPRDKYIEVKIELIKISQYI
jgi:hypothetical protein